MSYFISIFQRVCILPVILVALPAVVTPLALSTSPAAAQCVEVAFFVTCAANDTDGFDFGTDIVDLTVNEGVTVDDSGADRGGAAIIRISNDINGTLLNNGTIRDAIGAGDVAISASGTIGTLINNGTIASLDDRGVAVRDIGTLINDGTISGGEYGVFADALINDLTNNGTISGRDEDALRVNALHTLTNNGTISGGDDGVFATSFISNLTNNGTISGSNDDGVTARDITILTNNGTLSGGDHGVFASETIGTLINNGTISGGNHGVLSDDVITSLTNSGAITGGTNAIRETGAGDTTLTLLPGSDIFGAIDLGGGTNSLHVGSGLSIDHTFTTLPNVITTDGAPFVTDGTRVVVVDSALMGGQEAMVSALRQSIWQAVFSNVGDGRNQSGRDHGSFVSALAYSQTGTDSRSAFLPTTGDGPDSHVWATVFASHYEEDTASSTDTDHVIGGILAGLDVPLNPDIRLGGFVGFSQSDDDAQSLFGGAYASFDGNVLTLDLGLTGGTIGQNGSRLVDNNQVNGLQTVTGSTDGLFVAPQAALSSRFDGLGVVLQPTVSAGYTGLFLDGYSETGTTAPLTVADRDVHLLHGRFELAAIVEAMAAGDINYQFSPYIGIDGRQRVGGDTINATLLGQTLAFASGGQANRTSAFAGLRLSLIQSDRLDFNAALETGFGSNGSHAVEGHLSARLAF
ncbi:MAG: autotransporter domain-containing protein [Pseudomonadota bacterium]